MEILQVPYHHYHPRNSLTSFASDVSGADLNSDYFLHLQTAHLAPRCVNVVIFLPTAVTL